MTDSPEQSPHTDLSYLKSISDNDPDFIIDMINTYIENTPVFISELKQLMYQEKWAEIGDLAHKMKPSIEFMGINALKETILELQRNGRSGTNISEIPKLIERIEYINQLALKELRKFLENG